MLACQRYIETLLSFPSSKAIQVVVGWLASGVSLFVPASTASYVYTIVSSPHANGIVGADHACGLWKFVDEAKCLDCLRIFEFRPEL